MTQTNESLGGVGAPHEAAKIKLELANLAACRARNQATLQAAFGFAGNDPYASQKLAALKRRGIYARHGATFIPLIDGPDPLGAAIEVPPSILPHDDLLGHLTFNLAAPEPSEVTPDHIDADYIGRLEPDDRGTFRLAATVRDWLSRWMFAPSGLPDGRWDAWPGATLLCKFDDRTLRRIAWRLSGSRVRVAIIGNGARQRKIAEKLARLVVPPTPSVIRVAREVRT